MKKTFHLEQGAASTEVHKEIDLHLDLRAREFQAQGMSPDDARRAALDAFGDRQAIEGEVTGLRETTVRERRRRDWMDELRQDVMTGLRGLRRAPGFTVVALLTLGVGIGANTAIFSVLRSVLLRPLPYTHAEELVQVWSDHRALGRKEPEWLTPPDFEDWRDGNRMFSSMAAYQGWGPDLTGAGDPEALNGMTVSGSMFGMLDVKASLGRLLTTADDNAAAEPAVVLTNALWKRRFGSDSTILGKQLTLGGTPWTVIGVLPAEFRSPLPGSPEIFRTFRRPSNAPCGRGCVVLRVIGRLKPNVTLAAAQADLSRIAATEARDYPKTNDKVGVWLIPLHEQITGESTDALLTLSGAVAFVLLIGCVNIANLLLVRGAARAREFGVRAALGAGRGRITRQLLTENVLLAVMGGVLGLALGAAGSRTMATLVPESIRDVQEIRVDSIVLLFGAGITLLAALIFGLLPAFQAARSNLMLTLRSGARETGRSTGLLRNGLVVVQLSLAVVLLVGAGLLLRSFLLMQQVDLGFRSEGVMLAPVALPRARYADPLRAAATIDELVSRLRGDPAIRNVELVDVPPMTVGDQDIAITAVGEPERDDRPRSIWYRTVTPGYLSLMHMRLVAGRQLTAGDRKGSTPVAIINAEAARSLFPGSNALGRVLSTGNDSTSRKFTIVGIVASPRHDGPNQPYKNELYISLAQFPPRVVTVVMEPARGVAPAQHALHQAIAAVDPLLPVPALEPFENRLGNAVTLPRMYATLVGIFAAAALLLAVLGVYGVMAYTVTQRQREIGVRLALGAPPSRIRRMMLAHGGRLALLGVGIGLGAALIIGQLLGALLFGVRAFDAPTFGVVALVLGAMTLFAAWLPARRAMRVDPLTALRDG